MDDEKNRERLDQLGQEEDEAANERPLVPLQVSQVDFYGDRLMVVLVEIGGEAQVLVPLRQFCQYLGVDWASQYQRTKRDEILAREMMSVVVTTTLMPVRGQRQSYPALCLPLDLLPGWLFNINPSRVKRAPPTRASCPTGARRPHDHHASPAVQADETGWRDDGLNGESWSVSTPPVRSSESHHSRAGDECSGG